MFKKQDDGSERQLTGECGDKLGVNGWLTNVLESTGNLAQDFDGAFALLVQAMTSVEP